MRFLGSQLMELPNPAASLCYPTALVVSIPLNLQTHSQVAKVVLLSEHIVLSMILALD